MIDTALAKEAWFQPDILYRDGYPAEFHSAARRFPAIAAKIREFVAMSRARRVLEVGPGDLPLATGSATTYVDVASVFLTGKRSAVGKIQSLPFKTNSFQLALAIDVLPHVPPHERIASLKELARVSERVLVFNQEYGNPDTRDSYMTATDIVNILKNVLNYDVGVTAYDSAMTTPEGERHVPLTIICAARKKQAPPKIIRLPRRF